MSKHIQPRSLTINDFKSQYDSYGNPPKKMFYVVQMDDEDFTLVLKMAKTFEEIPKCEIIGTSDGKTIMDFFPVVLDIPEHGLTQRESKLVTK